MQKIMVIMLFWLLMPFYSWAISLEEIQSHPERYVKMDESRSCINYIDAESTLLYVIRRCVLCGP